VPANIAWGALLIALAIAIATTPIAFALVGLLAIPVAGMHRMAALIVRGGSVGFDDFVSGMRRFGLPALAVGTAATLLAFVLTTNIVIGLQSNNLAGWLLSAFALYGAIGLIMFLIAAWPILVDPLREELPVRRRLWLAAAVGITGLGRIFVLSLVITTVLVVSTVLFAALLTVSVAYVSLVATRYMLPAADRLEGRPTIHMAD
jgi:hypothetical protein